MIGAHCQPEARDIVARDGGGIVSRATGAGYSGIAWINSGLPTRPANTATFDDRHFGPAL